MNTVFAVVLDKKASSFDIRELEISRPLSDLDEYNMMQLGTTLAEQTEVWKEVLCGKYPATLFEPATGTQININVRAIA